MSICSDALSLSVGMWPRQGDRPTRGPGGRVEQAHSPNSCPRSSTCSLRRRLSILAGAGFVSPAGTTPPPSRRHPAAGRCDGRCDDLVPGQVIRSSFACCLRRIVATLGGVSVGVSGCEVPPVGGPPPTPWITRARLPPSVRRPARVVLVVLQERPQGLAMSVLEHLPVLYEVGEVAALHGDLDGIRSSRAYFVALTRSSRRSAAAVAARTARWG